MAEAMECDFNEMDTAEIAQDNSSLVGAFLQGKGLVKEHISSFNFFINTDIKNIVKANEIVTCDNSDTFYLKYKSISVGMPEFYDFSRSITNTTPHECRLRAMTYAAPIKVDIEYTRGKQIVQRNDVEIGRMPIMLRSSNCVLTGKDEKELAKMKECPLDPGGYFIVQGAEKVILIQEQVSKNRMIVEVNKKGLLACSVTSSTHAKKTITQVYMKDNKFYLQQNAFNENDIPIFIAFKAMGLESDRAIFGLMDETSTLVRSAEECHKAKIPNQQKALEYIASKVKLAFPKSGEKENEEAKLNKAREILEEVILCHIPVKNHDLRPKAIYMSLMVKRLLNAIEKNEKEDDKDFYGNKRFELAGSLLSLLFEDRFKQFNQQIKAIADKDIPKTRAREFDVFDHMRNPVITVGLESAIKKGRWEIKRFRMDRHGVTETLSRLNYISAISHLTRISSQFEKTRKISGPRSLHTSQWGMVCPSDTPEGESCGLVKNLALMAHITTDQPGAPVLEAMMELDLKILEQAANTEINSKSYYRIFINGRLEGITKHPLKLTRALRLLRRYQKFSAFASISTSDRLKTVNISTDGGRVCRPCIIVENGKQKVTKQHIEELKTGKRDFDSFVRDGLVEYLDANEENDCLIALYEDDITSEHTHLEIEPYCIYGICASIIPYLNHDQSPRITYQCAMGKQAIGMLGYNQHLRTDTLMLQLWYPQVPLALTEPLELLNYDLLPAGQNAIVAVMSFSGYDIEDALILNKASIERGYQRCKVTRSEKTVLKNHTCQGPIIEADTKKPIRNHRVLGPDGICEPGEMVEKGNVLINMWEVPESSATIQSKDVFSQPGNAKAVPRSYQNVDPAYVDNVMLCRDENESLLVRVTTRQSRPPEIGDKFSSRHGQKGVCGLIVPQEDMPFNVDGITPDVIMNPHGYPSRMTVGKLLELIGSKAATLSGKFCNSTVFKGTPLEEHEKVLTEYGYSYDGKEILTSGITGELIEAYIFTGPIYYQRLKHMVADKIHARATGPRSALTRQPTEGRSRDGGLRLGEMERDCLIGYGASNLLYERFVLSSDGTSQEICSKCGMLCYSMWCQSCRSSEKICRVIMPYAFKLLIQEMATMNVVVRLQLEEGTS